MTLISGPRAQQTPTLPTVVVPGSTGVDFRRAIWIAAWCAMALKLICAATTLGTVDVSSFYRFAQIILQIGLAPLYRQDLLFNHMPLVGVGAEVLYGITLGQPRAFAFFFRLPSIAADLVTIAALLRVVPLSSRGARWALLVLALSPVSFMVSGFHGNVDPIMTCFLVLAAVACIEKRPGKCALFFALAANIKSPALLLAPAFFFFWIARGAGWRFFALASTLTLAGWAYPLLVCPREFLTHTLGYGSYWGIWGVTYWLLRTGWEPFSQIRFIDLSGPQSAVMLGLKIMIVTGTLWLSWKRRRDTGTGLFQTIAGVWLFFMVFAPGVAGQYLVWPAPFLVLAWNRGYYWITAACTIHLVVYYTVLSGGFPWYFGYARAPTNPIWMLASNVPWIAFCIALGLQAKTLFTSPSHSLSGEACGPNSPRVSSVDLSLIESRANSA